MKALVFEKALWGAMNLGIVVGASLSLPAQAGHSLSECQGYARSAVDQFNALHATTCAPKPGEALWSDNYNGHLSWCTSTNADLGHEFKKRRLAIENCQKHSDVECNAYANNAVNQTREAVRNSCPDIGPPRWNENFQAHFTWCKSDLHGDLGQEFKQRRKSIEKCTKNSGSTPAAASITANVGINASGQKILSISGSGFEDKHTVTVTYNITQSRPGVAATRGSNSFNIVANNGTISGQVGVSCPAGFITTFSEITASDNSGGTKAVAVGNRGC